MVNQPVVAATESDSLPFTEYQGSLGPENESDVVVERQQYRVYPTDLWEYLSLGDEEGIPNLPSREDRDRLPEDRKRVWDYFFRISPDQVGKPQRKELQDNLRKLEQKRADLEDKQRIDGQQIEEKTRHIEHNDEISRQKDSITQRRRQLKASVRNKWWGGLFLVFVLSAFIILSLSNAFGIFDLNWYIGLTVGLFFIGGFFFFFFWLLWTWNERKEIVSKREQIRDIEEKFQQEKVRFTAEIADLRAGLEKLQTEYTMQEQTVHQRNRELKESIDALLAQIPEAPSDDEIYALLQKDIKRLKRDSAKSLLIETSIEPIVYYDSDDNAREIDNPIVFGSSGELQDPERIPVPYGPPSNSRPEPDDDLSLHLQSRRRARTFDGIEVLHGVYFFEYLFIAKDTMTIHGFFFDFINNQTTADKISEQYYQDVIAIEQSKEYRKIRLSLATGTTKDIYVLDAPSVSLSLPSGEKRTITFANRDYLRKIIGDSNDDSNQEDWEAFIRNRADDERQNADAAVRVLRRALKEHKRLNPGRE